MLGGDLTVGFNWRAIFWFLAILSGILTLGFLFFLRGYFPPRTKSHVPECPQTKAPKREHTVLERGEQFYAK